MTIMSSVMPMMLTLKSGVNIGCPITFPSPKVMSVGYIDPYSIDHYHRG